MALVPDQMEWAGLVIGDGQTIDFDPAGSIEGLNDLPAPRVSNVPRARAHGSLASPMFAEERTITVPLVLWGDDAADLVLELESVTAMRSDEQALAWNFGLGERQCFARVSRRAIPTTRELRQGVARATLQFVATDPRIYGTALHTASTGPGSTTGGLSFPHGFPHGFGLATSGSATLTNDGNAGAPWTATLNGPSSSPRIRLSSMDGELALDGFELAAGDTLTFDSLNRTVLLNGTASRYGSLTVRDWFEIPPGDSSLTFLASSGSGTLSMAWYSTWL